ncbi:MAG: UDP-N-acetylglucosamine 1-carboxyvinyltransferase [Planctomycetaceae bacterium]
MDLFVVRGGTPLHGRVAVSGSKNAALPIMAAALAAEGTSVIHGVPELMDVATLCELLRTLGAEVHRHADGALSITVVNEAPCVAHYDLVRRMRASVCVLGPLLARRGRACISLPGGCNIGDRPIDLHIKGLRALGAKVRVEKGYVIAECKKLTGNKIFLGGPFGSTVTGTCNIMSAAVLAEGITEIEAAACEPEVVDLGNFLNALGAKIEGLGTPFLRIAGVEKLTGAEHRIIPDRIEAATLMIAAAITSGNVELDNVRLDHLTAVVEKLQEIGVQISRSSDSNNVTVRASRPLSAADCIALPYPGLPTDVQAQFMTLLTVSQGMSVVTDKVFPDRFMHAAELVRLGAHIRREGPSAIISGVAELSGACVMASDLRASAALVLAGLAAKGESVIRRIYHLDRGYERLEEKLRQLGGDIQRLSDTADQLTTAAIEPQCVSDAAAHESWLTGPNWLTWKRARASLRPHASEGNEARE